jgi:hypothetical protein
MQVSSTSAQGGPFKPTKSFIGIENLGRKSTNLQSRCSVSALVSALVALFGRDPVVLGCLLSQPPPPLSPLKLLTCPLSSPCGLHFDLGG